MTSNLWSENHPRNFWLCRPTASDQAWESAVAAALPVLGLDTANADIDSILALTLGEGRFGPDHWRLSFPKRMYYLLKPILPRSFTKLLRRVYSDSGHTRADIQWPLEPRFATFMWKVLACLLQQAPAHALQIKSLWPEGRRFALVLTHDVESKLGVGTVRRVADLEESLGFRSSFNFVPEDYPVDGDLLEELCRRGFEVGVHGLKHDGHLFDSHSCFEEKAARINGYLRKVNAAGFRSPLTMREPQCMQALEIEYDLSFFDTDPFEPIPGGTMSIWPFSLGRFLELPYTLVQDYTLTDILKEDSPRLWLEKMEFLRKYCGMALLNSHPDFLRDPLRMDIYERFLRSMQAQQDCWKALPRDAAAWWKARPASDEMSNVSLDYSGVCVSPQGSAGSGLAYHVPLNDRSEQPALAERLSELAF